MHMCVRVYGLEVNLRYCSSIAVPLCFEIGSFIGLEFGSQPS